MEFKPLSNLPEQIAEHISTKIIRMEYKPGERLFETTIAKEFGISRSPIREAFRILEKKRLVNLIPRHGAVVTEISETYKHNLFDILISLVTLSAYKCIEHGTEENFIHIHEIANQAIKYAEQNNFMEYYNSIVKFALACLRATKNILLEQMVFDLMPCFQRILYASFSIAGQDLNKNSEIVKIGAKYLKEGNKEMAAKTVHNFIISFS